jgi:hypothetical protein
MPLQNRVTPFGEVIAVPHRGMLMGNRGIIHNPATRTLLRRRWATKAWIACRCDYKAARRAVMATRSWTELFFLDEATALAAGHRPCFLCRRNSAQAFRSAWVTGNGGPSPTAQQIDAILHQERLQRGAKRIHPLSHPVAELPDGAMVAIRDQAMMLIGGQALLWSPEGYRLMDIPADADGLLTPPATVAALRAGYRPFLHPSAVVAPSCTRSG